MTAQSLKARQNVVTIPDASATVSGVVNTTTQTFAGAKTFQANGVSPGGSILAKGQLIVGSTNAMAANSGAGLYFQGPYLNNGTSTVTSAIFSTKVDATEGAGHYGFNQVFQTLNQAGSYITTATCSSEGAWTFPTGIVGKTSAAGAGYVGELLAASATVGTNTAGAVFNVTSLALTAGIWLVTVQMRVAKAASQTYFQGGLAATNSAQDANVFGNDTTGGTTGEYNSFSKVETYSTAGETVYANCICGGANNVSTYAKITALRVV